MGLANERDFYRLQELTQNEINFIEKVAIENSPEILKQINMNFLNGFTEIYKLRNELEKKGLNDEEIDKKVDEQINNLEEDYHSRIEGISVKYIEQILQRDISFFETEDGRPEFLYYLCNQYMRTKKMKQNVIQSTSYQTKINVDKMWNVLRHIYAINVGFNLNRQDEYRLILLNNITSLPFITGDQPVINTFAVSKNISDPVDNLELYYPVSPTIGLLITRSEEYKDKTQVDIIDVNKIDQYNSYILEESHEQIYSNSEQVLKDILDNNEKNT